MAVRSLPQSASSPPPSDNGFFMSHSLACLSHTYTCVIVGSMNGVSLLPSFSAADRDFPNSPPKSIPPVRSENPPHIPVSLSSYDTTSGIPSQQQHSDALLSVLSAFIEIITHTHIPSSILPETGSRTRCDSKAIHGCRSDPQRLVDGYD